MSRTHRALAVLALSLAVVTATTAVAAAAPPVEDQNDRLLRNLEAAQAERTQAAVELTRSIERNTGATAAATAPVEDQNDRLLRNLEAAQPARTQAAVTLARSMERDLAPVPAVDVVPTQPGGRVAPVPGTSVDVLAALLLGLVGGLFGGGAAITGWIVATRRRVHRAAAA
jgi:hypothetical protein